MTTTERWNENNQNEIFNNRWELVKEYRQHNIQNKFKKKRKTRLFNKHQPLWF